MKRLLLLFIAVLTIISSASCGLMDDGLTEAEVEYRDRMASSSDIYPFYSSLSEEQRQIYDNICYGIVDHSETSIYIGEYDSKEEAEAIIDWINGHYREIMFEQPDIFWVNPYQWEIKTVESDKYLVSIVASYVIDKAEAQSKKDAYDKRVDEIVRGAESKTDLFDKVLYVYDEILSNAEYDDALAADENITGTGRSAYGCLIDGKTICSGYTLAFTSVMQKLGIENGVEFNSYADFSIFTGHVWNYLKLEDDYYYFDLTWDDTTFDSEEFKPYLDYSYTYFGLTRDELQKANYTISDDAPTPECNGTKYNYYVYKGQNFSSYSFDTVKDVITKNIGQKYVALRFDNYGDLYSAQSEFMVDGRIFEILPESASAKYLTNSANTVLFILFDY